MAEIERHWEGPGKLWEGQQVCGKVGKSVGWSAGRLWEGRKDCQKVSNMVRKSAALSWKWRRCHGSGDVIMTSHGDKTIRQWVWDYGKVRDTVGRLERLSESLQYGQGRRQRHGQGNSDVITVTSGIATIS